MLRHKQIDRIGCLILAATIALTCAFMGAAAAGIVTDGGGMGYEKRLFDQSRVHTIDIAMDDWDEFIDTCTNEEYAACTVVIDGEKFGSVAIRAKGNTSLSQVSAYGNDRYSFKIEFDHYESGKTYYGLDKLSLNNLIQDKTYMKDYLAYTLMNRMGVAAPLCSFVQISVNGQPWGLYLAVEAVEDGFLNRNYGSDHGDLYKPDSMSMGGGRGNGRDFDVSEIQEMFEGLSDSKDGTATSGAAALPEGMAMPGGMQMPEGMSMPEGMTMPGGMQMPEGMTGNADGASGEQNGDDSAEEAAEDGEGVKASRIEEFGKGGFGGGFGGMGSSDVMLQYVDDDPESYPNIFSSAKTDVSEADQERLIEALRKLSEGTLDEKLTAVDAEAMIRYLVVHDFMVNGDSYTGGMIHNYYLYEENGAISMLPWDYNLAFGAFNMGGGFGSSGATSTVNSPIDSPVSSGDISTRPAIAWIFESEEYTGRYHEVYAEFLESVYESGWLTGEIERVSQMIAPYVKEDVNGFFSYEEFEKAAETLKEFCALRCQSIAGQLDGSVPSATEAQRANQAALIDASHIDLNDLGEFGMGGGFGGDRGGMETPGDFDPSSMFGSFGGQSGEKKDGSREEDAPPSTETEDAQPQTGEMPGGFDPNGMGNMPGGFGGELPEGFDPGGTGGMPGGFGGWTQDGNMGSTGMTPQATTDVSESAAGEPEKQPVSEGTAAPGTQPEATGQSGIRNMETGRAGRNREGGSFEMPGMGEWNGQPGGAVSMDQWIMLGACAAALLAGIALAMRAKSGR